MDLDAYVLAHAHEWQRLEELGHRRRLTGAESDELVERYQQVATHLSVVRTSAPDAALVAHLSSVLARARNRAVGARVSSWGGFLRFFTERFPAALYRLRYWWLGRLVANVVVVAVLILWLLDHPNVEQSLLSPAEIDQLVNHDVEGYYSEYAASHFAFQVWVNNAWVSALCLAFGILGLPVIYLLWNNVLNLAIIGSIMTRADQRPALLGADPPARAARADRRLRRRRRRAQAVLVLDRTRVAHPDASPSRGRVAPPGRSRWAWSSCCSSAG